MTDDGTPDIHDYLKSLEQAPETFRWSWDAIAIYDLEGRAILGNAVARAMVGPDRTPGLQGGHFSEHMTLEAAAKATREFARCATLGETVDSESAFLDGAGEPIPVRTRLVPARAGGRIVGVIGFASDQRHQRDIEEQFMRTERQFRSLFENHPDALALHDLQGRFVRLNAAAERLTGYSAEELIGQAPDMLSPTGQFDREPFRAAIERGDTIEFEHAIKTKNGNVREVEGRRVPLLLERTIHGYCTMIRDVTEERRAARNSARQATRIAELYRIAASAGVAAEEKITTALEAGLTELGAAWAYVAQLDGDDFLYTAGKRAAQLSADEASHVDRARLASAMSAGDVFVVDGPETTPRVFSGAPFSVEGKPYGAVVFVHGNGPAELTATDRDYIRALAVLIGSAIQQGERERRLDTLAFGDALTGLPNRALLQDRLEQTLLFARRHRRSFAAHYIDVDHFKAINDTYGHQAGDAVLIAVSAWLRSMLRDSDTIGRIGGDEFVVLQPEIDSQRQAEELASKLCSVRDQTFHVGEHDIVVTLSVGCAVFPVDAENPVDMLRAADTALYEVKARGRDGYAVGTIT